MSGAFCELCVISGIAGNRGNSASLAVSLCVPVFKGIDCGNGGVSDRRGAAGGRCAVRRRRLAEFCFAVHPCDRIVDWIPIRIVIDGAAAGNFSSDSRRHLVLCCPAGECVAGLAVYCRFGLAQDLVRVSCIGVFGLYKFVVAVIVNCVCSALGKGPVANNGNILCRHLIAAVIGCKRGHIPCKAPRALFTAAACGCARQRLRYFYRIAGYDCAGKRDCAFNIGRHFAFNLIGHGISLRGNVAVDMPVIASCRFEYIPEYAVIVAVAVAIDFVGIKHGCRTGNRNVSSFLVFQCFENRRIGGHLNIQCRCDIAANARAEIHLLEVCFFEAFIISEIVRIMLACIVDCHALKGVRITSLTNEATVSGAVFIDIEVDADIAPLCGKGHNAVCCGSLQIFKSRLLDFRARVISFAVFILPVGKDFVRKACRRGGLEAAGVYGQRCILRLTGCTFVNNISDGVRLGSFGPCAGDGNIAGDLAVFVNAGRNGPAGESVVVIVVFICCVA